MQFERLGVVTFFGILVPGAYLMSFLLFAVTGFLELYDVPLKTFSFITNNDNILFVSSVFVLTSYLVGVVLRLFAPTLVDTVSTLYLVHIRRKRDEWITDVFPYKNTLTPTLDRLGMKNIHIMLSRHNKQYGVDGNTMFFNYCKLFIETNNDILGEHIREDEALIRFLSGTSLALMICSLLGFILSLLFFIQAKYLFFQAYLVLSIISCIILATVLERFKNQRRREVTTVWESLYLLLQGSVPNKTGISPNELQSRFCLEQTPDMQLVE